jgi:hypothetical protein
VRILLRRDKHTNKATGEMRDRLVRTVMSPDPHARFAGGPLPRLVKGGDDAVRDEPIADYDDSPETLARGKGEQ